MKESTMFTQSELSAIKQIPEITWIPLDSKAWNIFRYRRPQTQWQIWPAVLGEGAFLYLPIVQGRHAHPLQSTLGNMQGKRGLITRGGMTNNCIKC